MPRLMRASTWPRPLCGGRRRRFRARRILRAGARAGGAETSSRSSCTPARCSRGLRQPRTTVFLLNGCGRRLDGAVARHADCRASMSGTDIAPMGAAPLQGRQALFPPGRGAWVPRRSPRPPSAPARPGVATEQALAPVLVSGNGVRSGPAADVPTARQQVTAEDLREQNLFNPEDALKYVPNTSIRKRYIGDRNLDDRRAQLRHAAAPSRKIPRLRRRLPDLQLPRPLRRPALEHDHARGDRAGRCCTACSRRSIPATDRYVHGGHH